MAQKYHLISSYTCPWVQRSVITMRAKGVEFDVTWPQVQHGDMAARGFRR